MAGADSGFTPRHPGSSGDREAAPPPIPEQGYRLPAHGEIIALGGRGRYQPEWRSRAACEPGSGHQLRSITPLRQRPFSNPDSTCEAGRPVQQPLLTPAGHGQREIHGDPKGGDYSMKAKKENSL